MRRGLIARSRVELPDAVFDARLARLRAAMGGLDALLVYTNNTRPAAVSCSSVSSRIGRKRCWCCRATAADARRRADVRVKPWIERTSRVAEVVFTAHRDRDGAPDRRRRPMRPSAWSISTTSRPVSRTTARGRPAPRIFRRQRAVRGATRHRRPRRNHVDRPGVVDRGQRLVPHRPARARHRRHRGGGRRRGAPVRRRGGLCGGGDRPRPRPPAGTHRNHPLRRARARRALRGASVAPRALTPRGDDRPRWHAGCAKTRRSHRRAVARLLTTAPCRDRLLRRRGMPPAQPLEAL